MEEVKEEESGASSLSSLALCLPVLLHLSLFFDWYAEPGLFGSAV